MMLQRVVFGGLLFGIRYAVAATPPASWTTPTASDGDLKANTQDSVWLDWTSTYATPVLRMWCWDDEAGGEALASSFSIDNNGPFEYIMDSFMEPNKMPYPLSCQAELANGDSDNNGIRCPVKIVWSLNADIAMKTVNAPEKTIAAAAPSSTSVKVMEPKVTGTGDSSSESTASPSNTEQSTTDSPSQSTGNPTSSTEQSSSSSTGGSEEPLSGGSESDSNATTAPVASTSSSSNNTGAIVGGVVGGIAVLSFIVFAFLFLRRQKRNRTTSYSATTNSSSIWNLYFSNSNKKGLAAENGPVYEKEGSGMARELEANSAGGAWKANHTALYSPVELPAGSNQYPR